MTDRYGLQTIWTAGDVLKAADLLDTIGNIYTQLLSNQLGQALDGVTPTSQDQFVLDLFDSDTAVGADYMIYDATNDYYKCMTTSGTDRPYIVIIQATSLTVADFAINDCTCLPMTTAGNWMLFCSSGTYEVNRAKVMKTLFMGNTTSFSTGTATGIVLNITGLTALLTNDSRDISKRAHVCYAYSYASHVNNDVRNTGTFVDTTNNTDCSSWSAGYTAGNTSSAEWDLPGGTLLDSCSGNYASYSSFSTDTSADEDDNPANCYARGNATSGGSAYGRCSALILSKGDITWAHTGTNSPPTYGATWYEHDYYTDSSVPDFTELTSAAMLTCKLVTDDLTIAATNIRAIMRATSSIDATSALTLEVSFDGGTNYQAYTHKTMALADDTGTGLRWRFTITRTDATKEDNVSAYAAYYL